MSKKVLIISTSPRKNGNSETLADAFLKGVIDGGNTAEKISLYDKTIGFCRRFKMKSKLLQLFSCVTVIAILLSGCASGQRESSSEAPALSGSEITQATDDSSMSDMGFDTEKESSTIINESTPSVSQKNDNSTTEENTVEKMTLQIGNNTFTATLENNDAVDVLVNMMREEPVVIQMSDYSGFEKVGSLGTSLPASNKQTTTQSGDIVLYNGNQIVIFYGSNSWSYTRLGRIDDLSGWEDALGSDDVTVTFSLE